MKRLLALAAVLIPIYLFSQGFGSFSHDQPYMAKDSVSGGTPYATNLFYRWVATDLATNTFTSWPDQIQSKTLSPQNGFTMSNTTNGVFFATSTQNCLTNGSSSALLFGAATNADYIVALIIKAEGTGSGRVLFNKLDGTPGFVLNESGGTVTWKMSGAAGNVFSNPINQWIDVMFGITNSSVCVCYTNGVFATSSSSFFPIRDIGNWFDQNPNDFGFLGNIREIWYRTNTVTASSLESAAIDLHYTRTNLYGP